MVSKGDAAGAGDGVGPGAAFRGRDGRRARGLRRGLTSALRASGEIRTSAVAEAFAAVPRHLFVPDVALSLAYADIVVPTKFDRGGDAISALSQPAIVAVMLEQLDVRPGMRVLEIGAGTGYNAGLLGRLVGGAGRVVTVDVDEDIVEGARRHLAAAAATPAAAAGATATTAAAAATAAASEASANIEVVLGDGALGYGPGAPYDRIIATVEAADVPAAWFAQLAPEGKVVLPLRIRGGVTRSVVLERESQDAESRDAESRDAVSQDAETPSAGLWRGSRLEVCSFMPLRGIANDAGEYVELTADGLVAVSVYAEQHVGADLARALEHEGHERFTGVLFGSGESFSDLDLYLTCALPGGMSRLSATGPAVASSVVRPQFNWGAMCTVDGDSLAYLTLRQPEYEDSRVGSWEAGVVGHGPHGAALADEVAAHIRTWGAELRGAPAVLRIAQGDGRERLTGRCVVDKEFSRIAVDWIA